MKILFIARHATYYRNFESAIRLLAERGHQLHLAVEMDEDLGGRGLVERLTARPGVTSGPAPKRRDTRAFQVARALRLSADYFRYLDRSYDDAPALRLRAWERTPRLGLMLARRPLRWVAAPLLRAIERAVPLDEDVHRFVEEQRPDVLLLTPLIELGSPQLDFLKSAQALGIPTALCVWSWDHLTSKSLIRVVPDRVLVWNATQRREAIDLHRIPAERVTVTGAQCFDHWFDRAPSRTRAEFCRDAGLPDDRPFVLYVCSSLLRGSPSEAAFVRRWLEALRGCDHPSLRDAPVLVRPHPQRTAQWEGVNLSDLGAVSVWGDSPMDPRSRADYFESLYHATAVVGLNTSALIEAAIVDRPVHTVLLPEFQPNQSGTHHFRYLLEGPTAFLRAARTLPEHLAMLARAMAGEREARNRVFVEHFVRPHGVDAASTPAFADAVEGLRALRPQAAARGTSVLAPVFTMLASLAGTAWGHRLLEDPLAADERRSRDGRLAEKQVLIDRRRRLREQKEEDKRRRWRDKRRRNGVVRLKTAAKRLIG